MIDPDFDPYVIRPSQVVVEGAILYAAIMALFTLLPIVWLSIVLWLPESVIG